MGTRGELAWGETQIAGGPAVLKVPNLLPVKVHVDVAFGQGALAVRHGGLHHRPVAADVPHRAHRGYSDASSPRTAAARPRPGPGSRPGVGPVRCLPPSRSAHARSLLYTSRVRYPRILQARSSFRLPGHRKGSFAMAPQTHQLTEPPRVE